MPASDWIDLRGDGLAFVAPSSEPIRASDLRPGQITWADADEKLLASLPSVREQLTSNAAASLAHQMDAEIESVLTSFCPGWSMADVKTRGSIVWIIGSSLETFCMDGVPLLEMLPITSTMERKGHSWVITYTRSFRRLVD